MFVYPYAVSTTVALAWPGDGVGVALMLGGLAAATVLGSLALRRRPRLVHVAAIKPTPPVRDADLSRAAA